MNSRFFDLTQDHVASTSKDRTGLFDGHPFIPTTATGETLSAWRNGGGVPVANGSVTKNGHTMPEGTPPERKRGITTEELKNFGVGDPEATAAALEKKLGKKLSDFDERETEAVWALLNRKKLAKEAQEEYRRKFDECQDPLPWEVGDDQGNDT